MKIPSAIARFLAPERNVGGGDLVARVLSIAVLLFLVGIVVPQLHVPYPLIKISLLITTELGLVSLMLALFLRSKTYFVGVQLFAASLMMLSLARHQLTYVAVVIGVAFAVAGIVEVATRRSRLNGLLGVNSFHKADGEAAMLLAVALQPDGSEPVRSEPRAEKK